MRKMQLIFEALRSLSLARLSIPSESGQAELDNTIPYPGLPVTNPPPSSSYWIAHNRGSSNTLLGWGHDDDVPENVEVVIIGAGISGATAAHFLMNAPDPPGSVVLLEAREVASGATGRNGGFIKPVPFRTYPEYKALHGIEEALHLVQSEYDALDLTHRLVIEGSIDADFTIQPHHEIILDAQTAERERSKLEELRRDRARLRLNQSDNVTWHSDMSDARNITRSKAAVEAYTYPTGSMWPHKFVHGLLSNILRSPSPSPSFKLFTRTPALRVSPVDSNQHLIYDRSHNYREPRWQIQTSRGNITASKLILTTNGYTGALLPDLFGPTAYSSSEDTSAHCEREVSSQARGRKERAGIVPKRTQLAAYTIPSSFIEKGGPLKFSFNVRGFYNTSLSLPFRIFMQTSCNLDFDVGDADGLSKKDLDAIHNAWGRCLEAKPALAGIVPQQVVQEEMYGLTTSDGTLIVGSELAHRAADVDGQDTQWMGNADDSEVMDETRDYYQWVPRIIFNGWDKELEGVGEGLIRTWTGCVRTFKRDGQPSEFIPFHLFDCVISDPRIQGRTLDTLPFVGAVPNHPGLYVSAGFHGHGMARCVIASRGLVHQLLSPTQAWDIRVPRPFEITQERLVGSYIK